MKPNYKEFAINLAQMSGEIMRKNFTLGMNKEWKSDNSPLTVTDKAINNLVIKEVNTLFPDHSVVAEEGSSIVKESDYTWVCDPIDGTFPFSHGYPCFVFSLALTYKGKSILGVIYDPIMDRMFFAQSGKGTYLNGAKTRVSNNKIIQNTVLDCVTWSGAKYELFPVFNLISKSGGHPATILSICYSSSLVACGEFSASIYPDTKPWDAAAVKIIVEEAGGIVTDLFGNDQHYDKSINGFIASNGYVHNQLLKLIKSSLSQ